jgi:hypothetical protein
MSPQALNWSVPCRTSALRRKAVCPLIECHGMPGGSNKIRAKATN